MNTVPITPANNSVTNNQTGARFEAYRSPVLKQILTHIKPIDVNRALVVIDSEPFDVVRSVKTYSSEFTRRGGAIILSFYSTRKIALLVAYTKQSIRLSFGKN